MQWISSEAIILGALEEHGIENIGRVKDSMLRHVRHAIQDIGLSPHKNLVHSTILLEDDGSIPKPEGMIHLYEIMLKGSRGLVRPAYLGPLARNQYGGGAGYHQPNSIPALAQQGGCWFFVSGNPAHYQCALVAYLAIKRDCNGYPMVPVEAETAVYAYLHLKILQRKRNLEKAVTQQEIQDSRDFWRRQAGSARGEIAIGDNPEFVWRAYDEFHNPGMTRGPKKHL